LPRFKFGPAIFDLKNPIIIRIPPMASHNKINTQKGGLQLAATIRTTREGPQTGTHKAAVPRGHKEETDGGQGGGRCRKRAAAEAAAVT
jgi:hypothetical protein